MESNLVSMFSTSLKNNCIGSCLLANDHAHDMLLIHLCSSDI